MKTASRRCGLVKTPSSQQRQVQAHFSRRVSTEPDVKDVEHLDDLLVEAGNVLQAGLRDLGLHGDLRGTTVSRVAAAFGRSRGVDATRGHLTMTWMVSGRNLSCFGPRRAGVTMSVRTAPKSKKKPPTSSEDGDDARRWREEGRRERAWNSP